jgi:hypothetical protein
MTRTKYIFGESTINEMNMNNWKENLKPYLYKHRTGGSGATNDLLDAIQAEIIEKLIAEIPIDYGCANHDCSNCWGTYNSAAQEEEYGHKSLKQQLKSKWL